MNIAIIINANRITPDLETQLKKTALSEKYHVSYDLFIIQPKEIKSIIAQLNRQSYNAFIIGGGDGTVRSAIQQLIDIEVPIAILPLGTFNLLAKSLNHINNIESILMMVKNNKTKQIDLAEVNGHIIINHAWIGFYYNILKFREKHKDTLGTSKFLKLIFNILSLLKPVPFFKLSFNTENIEHHEKTCLVYIGNDESYTNLFDFGERKTLTAGFLDIAIVNCINRWDVFKLIWHILFNNFNNSKYITRFKSSELTINAKHTHINTVVDGELFQLKMPLKFKTHPKKLTVFHE